METKFNFESAICTSREQSERLLALGLKMETADCMIIIQSNYVKHKKTRVLFGYNEVLANTRGFEVIPAWSLHRLIEMMPSFIKGFYTFSLIYDIKNNTIGYISANGVPMQSFKGINIFDNIIFAIKWLIKEGYFNKEYLNGTTEN